MKKASLGFIGTGVMGRSMAGHLLKAGHPVNVFNRTRAKADALVAAGAVWRDDPRAVAEHSEVIITIVGFPADVEQTYFGERGVLAGLKAGAICIDMTTSSPALAQRISAAALAKGGAALDAPVSGGDLGAREARLAIMVGGDPAAFATVKPILEIMGKNVVLQGPPGAGQHCKLANQVAIASGMLAWVEALTYARRAGLDPARVLESIGGGAAGSWAMTNLAPRALQGNFAPGFFVKHFRKDMRLAVESAGQLQLDLPGLTCAQAKYDELARAGGDDQGTQALYRLYNP